MKNQERLSGIARCVRIKTKDLVVAKVSLELPKDGANDRDDRADKHNPYAARRLLLLFSVADLERREGPIPFNRHPGYVVNPSNGKGKEYQGSDRSNGDDAWTIVGLHECIGH